MHESESPGGFDEQGATGGYQGESGGSGEEGQQRG